MTGRTGVQDAIAKRQIRVGDLAVQGLPPQAIASRLGAPLRIVRSDLEAMGFELPTRHHRQCGSTHGYRQHHKFGEKPCDACRDAKRKARGR
ncbi:hypothetical protein [Gordonia sp. KTR9]|uniref:hypothetical protein n=1 Tax=Gordonia sp. KTR9 TaxID=337191 RepID=UPI0005C80E24|nr:hypothetical protein [Gordonia sp. KTR9]